MTITTRITPKPLTIYRHLSHDSQCGSCNTVMPGDICFNCGRLSTLLVTPSSPRRRMTDRRVPGVQCPALAMNPLPQSSLFVPQNDGIRSLLDAHESEERAIAEQSAFDRQFNEVDDLLGARRKLARVNTLAASDVVLTDERSPVCSSFSKLSTDPPTTRGICSSRSSLLSDSVAVSEIQDRKGNLRAEVVAPCIQEKKHYRSKAELTRRGVDCRLQVGDRIYEWVIFL